MAYSKPVLIFGIRLFWTACYAVWVTGGALILVLILVLAAPFCLIAAGPVIVAEHNRNKNKRGITRNGYSRG